jgi:hypothetical protein
MEERLAPLPDWIAPLCEEIDHELDRLDGARRDRRPALERERADLRRSLQGLSISLAKPDLDPGVRADVEAEYARIRERSGVLEAELAGLDLRDARRDQLVDPRRVLDRLRRLDEVLATGNVTMGNLELARHIDRIDVYPDRRVVMRTSKLGIFEGATSELARADPPTPGEAAGPGTPRIRPRPRGPMRIDETPTPAPGRAAEIPPSVAPDRFANLDGKWFWEDTLEIPGRSSWAADHADEAARLRGQGWTIARLAAHFGRTPPTIRHALKIASGRDRGGTDAPGSRA